MITKITIARKKDNITGKKSVTVTQGKKHLTFFTYGYLSNDGIKKTIINSNFRII